MKVNSTAFLLFSEPHPVLDVFADFADRNPFLLHGIPVTDGDGLGFFGFEVHADAEGRTDFVLTAVPFADGAGFVVFHR